MKKERLRLLFHGAITASIEREERREDERRWSRYEKTGHFVANATAMAWLDDLAHGKRRPAPR